jgi:SagB-type dehydrogenase family enzyme
MNDIYRVCREFQKNTGYFTDDEPDPTRTFDMGDYPGPYKTYEGAPRVDLPRKEYSDWSTPIGQVLAARRSKRNFLPDPITLDELGFALWATQGITADMNGYKLRTAPSAGALYPVETYLVVRAVDGLAPGIYHLSVEDFQLELLKEGDFVQEVFQASHTQEMVRLAAVNFLWSALIERCVCKYYERGYRYIYEDVGHISANLQLACTAMDRVGCAVIGAFLDDMATNLLDLDCDREPVVMMGSVGKVTGADFKEDRRTYMEKLARARAAEEKK